jgi:hypothetical protein
MMAGDLKTIRKALIAQGWTIRTGTKHDVAYPPDKSKSAVVLPSTPGGGRWRENLLAQLRRSGFRWEDR